MQCLKAELFLQKCFQENVEGIGLLKGLFSLCVLPLFGVKLMVTLGSIGPNVLVLKALFLVSNGSGGGA